MTKRDLFLLYKMTTQKSGVFTTALLVVSMLPSLLFAAEAAFLESKLPLKVVSIMPSSKDETEFYDIRRRDAISVAFSRPVIALGSDYGSITKTPTGSRDENDPDASHDDNFLPDDKIPFRLHKVVNGKLEAFETAGKLRWVTTFISRFDTDIDWPTDLDILLEVNPKLTSYDSLKLVSSLSDTSGKSSDQSIVAKYRTPSLSMYISNISSKRAYELSSGHWTPGENFETPPDALVKLSFTYDVELKMIANALTVSATGDSSNIPTIAVYPCDIIPDSDTILPPLKTRCVQITPRNLDVDMKYSLTLPAGTRYNQLAGPLRSDLTVTITGLNPFRFRWVESWQLNHVSFSHWDLTFSHGLDDSVSVEQLMDTISITETNTKTAKSFQNANESLSIAVTYTAELVDSGTLRLCVNDSKADTDYSINVDDVKGVVKDGFGLMLQSDSITIHTSSLRDTVYDITNNLVLESKPESGWSFLVRGANVGYSLTDATNKISHLLAEESFSWRNKYTGNTTDFPSLTRKNVEIPSNFFIRKSTSSPMAYFTTITDLYVATVGDARQITAWVLRFSNGVPIEGAVCYFLGTKGEDYGHIATNTDGECSNTEKNAAYLYVDYNNGEEIAFTELPYRPSDRAQFRSIIITDRAVYKPGDDVHFKGYTRCSTTQPRWSLCEMQSSRVEAHVRINGKREVISTEVKADENYGSWFGTLSLPSDIELRPVTLSFGNNDQFEKRTTTTIAIANPRRPTASMKLGVGVKVHIPGKPLPVSVIVISGTNLPIENAEVLVQWTHSTNPNPIVMPAGDGWWNRPVEPVTHTGAFSITTGVDGTGTYNLDLNSELEQQKSFLEIGDFIYMNAQWVGPTGELVEQSVELAVDVSEWTVVMELTVGNPIPGFNFGVTICVRDSDGYIIETTATVTLETFTNDTTKERGDILIKCNADTGDAQQTYCSDILALPAADKYRLRAEVVDHDGVRVGATLDVGQTKEEWERNPLKEFSVLLKTDKDEYTIGEDVTISFLNPFSNARLLITWGNVNGYHRKILEVTQGDVSQVISTEGIEGGCGISAFLFAPRQTGLSMPISVPISKSWDFQGPRSVSFSTYLKMIDNDSNLPITVSPSSKQASPGEKVELIVTIADNKSNGPVDVAIVAVDNAFLQIMPMPLLNLSDTFFIEVPAELSYHDTTDFLFSAKSYEAALDSAFRRYKADQWINPAMRICCESDEPDNEYLDRYSTWLTESGDRMQSGIAFDEIEEESEEVLEAYSLMDMSAPMDGAMVPTIATSKSASTGPGDFGDSVASYETVTPVQFSAIRTNFEVTPLFQGQVLVNGSATVALKLPDIIGTYSIRAYAVDRDNRFGSTETKVITKKMLNLQSMLPRIARVGDHFQAGVTVELDVTCIEGGSDVEITASSRNGVLSITDATQKLTFRDSGPHKVKFDMIAQTIGDGIVTFLAKSDCGTDGLEGTLPVLPLQDQVIIATSMAISGSKDSDNFVWNEGIEFPPASPGSGKIVVRAGVGHLPSLEAFVASIAEPKYAGDYLSLLGLLAAMIPYGGTDKKAAVLSQLLGKVDRFEDELKELTSDVGLEWSRRDTNSFYSSHIKYVDAWLNANALLIAKRLEKQGAGQLSKALTHKWSAALKSELDRHAHQARANGDSFQEWDLLARSYLALGSGFTQDSDMTLVKLVSNRNRMSHNGLILLSLYLTENPTEDIGAVTSPTIIRETLDLIYNRIRVQGQTAYVGTGDGRRNPLSLEAQGLTVSLYMTDRGAFGASQTIDKVAKWIGRGNARDGGAYRSFGYTDLVFGAFGLADYDMVKSSNHPDMFLSVDSGNQNILRANFNSSSNPTVTSTKNWSELSSVTDDYTPERIVISGSGDGVASVAVELLFVPDQLATRPVYNGIFVDKIVRNVDPGTGKAVGDPLQVIEVGNVVEVTIQMTTADDLRTVTLLDYVVAGLEPIDENIASTPGRKGVTSSLPESFCSWWYYTPFDNPETKPDRVKWSASWVSAGTHSASYRAVAVTEGVFAVSPAKAFANDQPEVNGLSWSGLAVLTSDKVPEGKSDDLLQASNVEGNTRITMARECLVTCAYDQECNIVTGKCESPDMVLSLFVDIGDTPVVSDTSWTTVMVLAIVLLSLILVFIYRKSPVNNEYSRLPTSNPGKSIELQQLA